MALLGLRRDDITIRGINGEDQFGLRWHRLLFPAVGMPAAHLGAAAAVNFGPAVAGDANPAPTNRSVPMLDRPIEALGVDAPASGDQDSLGVAPAANPTGGVPVLQAEDALAPLAEAASAAGDANPFSHPPYFAPGPDVPAAPAPEPADAAPPGGFIPKSEAVIWSGPALMVFPAEGHEAEGDAAAPDLTDTGDTAAPDVAGTPDAVTRADLDPVLASMGSAPSGVDLSAAFLPPESGDLAPLPHGLDPGFAFTTQPLPPPPDFI